MKRMLPNGRVEFSRAFYVTLTLLVLATTLAAGADVVFVILKVTR